MLNLVTIKNHVKINLKSCWIQWRQVGKRESWLVGTDAMPEYKYKTQKGKTTVGHSSRNAALALTLSMCRGLQIFQHSMEAKSTQWAMIGSIYTISNAGIF